MENINTKFATGRLELLKQSAILDNCAGINFDSSYDIYNSVIRLFVEGNFDPIYNSPAFKDLTTDERRKLLKDGRKYIELCMGNGGIGNWAEYASKYCGDDYDLCFISIFRNFDILLTILRYGKEGSMELLSSLNSSKGDFEGSIIDELKLYFPDENIMIQAMIEMGQRTNAFSQYPDSYKRLLCKFSNGVLYIKENDEYLFRSPLSIALDVRKKISGETIPDTFDYDKYKELINDPDEFTDAIMSLSYDNMVKSNNFEQLGHIM